MQIIMAMINGVHMNFNLKSDEQSMLISELISVQENFDVNSIVVKENTEQELHAIQLNKTETSEEKKHLHISNSSGRLKERQSTFFVVFFHIRRRASPKFFSLRLLIRITQIDPSLLTITY